MSVADLSPITPYHWDATTSAWVEALVATAAGAGAVQQDASAACRVATLNILADCFPLAVRLATPPKRRIDAAIERIVELNPDVLGLNEVTPRILTWLLANDTIRSRYYTTHVPDTVAKPHGCVVLSRARLQGAWQMASLHEMEGAQGADGTAVPAHTQGRRPIVVRLPNDLILCSVHTVAYQTAPNRAMRAMQLKHISSVLGALSAADASRPPFIIMGDLNLHDLCEDAVIVDNGLLDLWAETHPKFVAARDMCTDEADAGLTFDAKTNSMIPRYIPGETRRMRLDRILLSRDAPFRAAAPCRLWANEAVDAKKEIYISDHYGLAIDLVASPDAPWNGNPAVERELRVNAALDAAPRNFSKWRFSIALTQHLGWLAMRSVGML
jgi:endonuclease/exonuclease/phosphatase family metal-dependent hydrolase